tara:strand:+ start:594 stop:2060 length:1467 start_codon:yes stop_codon:yes gene_type:complete
MALFKAPNKLRKRIYISMLALLMAAFFFIGGFTYYNFKTQNQDYHDKRLSRKEAATLASISYFFKNQKSIDSDNEKISLLFENKLFELADIHNLDLFIYSLKGELIISSNKSLVEKNIIPTNISRTLLSELKIKKSRIKMNLSLSGMGYLNSYQYLRNKNQVPIAIISIPYFQLDETYKRDLRDYLVALTPIYILLFIGANLLALLLSRQISDPMKRLSETMREAAVKKQFMPLEWASSDEIGQLVRQYNFMVKELEKSSEILAQNEKENAWKQMARQVAHEIKNPLTPMKLNIQLFERQLDPKDPMFKEKIKSFSSSIIEQIDILSNIASAFSNFSRMPSSVKVKLDLSKVIENIIQLYTAVNIELKKPKKPCYIFADKNQIIRMLNNLINNAIESIAEPEIANIKISIKPRDENLLLSVEDNGVGIAKALDKKIFNPSFTTKNSGMGLGLAIVKRIIDDLGGSIHFKSEENKGTIFYMNIPSIKTK